jgi:ribosome biogenesis GTPase
MAEQVAGRSGLVVALQANYCLVELDGPCEPGTDGAEPGRDGRLLCSRRTRLDKSGLQVCVGDRVRVGAVDWQARRGAVVGLEPRQSLLERPAVANVSRVVVVVAVAEPGLDPLQLTRFLITAEATGQPVQVVLSKADLLPPEEVRAWCRRLEGWGYGTVAVSTRSGEGLEALRRQLAAGRCKDRRERGTHTCWQPSSVSTWPWARLLSCPATC